MAELVASGELGVDSVQPVVLNAKLERLEKWNEPRRAAATVYDVLLSDIDGVRLPRTLDGKEHLWHLDVVRVADRDCVQTLMHEPGGRCRHPLPESAPPGPAYASPGSEEAASRSTRGGRGDHSVPLHPHINEAQQQYVSESLRRRSS